jgi:hypothetical protein
MKVCGGSEGCFAVSVLWIESNWAEGFYWVFCGSVKDFLMGIV